MNEVELKELLKNAEVEKTSYRRIRSRRYNVEIVENGEIVEVIPYIASHAKATEIANEIRHDGSGRKCNIVEDCTFDNNWNEIKFAPRAYVEIPTGRMSFATPEMTPNRIKIKRAQNEAKADAKRARMQKSVGRRIMDPEHMPGTEMHKAYVRTVKRDGYTVKYNGEVIFVGLQKETSEFIYDYLRRHNLNVKDIEIIWHGKDK